LLGVELALGRAVVHAGNYSPAALPSGARRGRNTEAAFAIVRGTMLSRRSAPSRIGQRWSVALGIAATCSSLAASAEARDGDRIVLVTTDATSTTSRRLQAELRSLGLEVVVTVLPSAVGSRTVIEKAARSANAMAAIYVVAEGTRAELWIVDRVTNKTVIRDIVATDTARDVADDAIAVGVAELLRASLLEVARKAVSPGEYPATARVREIAGPSEASPPATERRSRFSIDVGGGAEIGVRGTGTSVPVHAAIGWHGPNDFGLEAIAGTTLVPARVAGSQGSAEVSSHRVGAGGTFQWEPAASIVSGRLGLGFMAVRLETRGEAIGPFVSSTSAGWAFGPYLHAGPAFGSSSLRVRLDFGVFVAVRTPRILFDDQWVATWGQPALFATLGVEAMGRL
jgi:hypothetical protein